MNIIAVVVTYNRKVLLKECIDAILNQTKPITKLIVIDNNSTDGTYEMLENENYLNNNKVFCKRLEKNTGGSGGFYEGMKLARTLNPDWVWIMDDDTIPNGNSLEELVKAKEVVKEKVGFFASSVYGLNGECMNVPTVNIDLSENGYADWYRYLSYGMIKIKEATFVSLLINGEALKEVGLPCKDYFIWGDDTEYTLRLNKYFGNAYMVGNSEVIHKRKGGKALTIIEEENKSRINMYFYMTRNNYINIREYKSKKQLFKFIVNNLNIFKILFSKTKYKFLKIRVILKGLFSGIFKRYNYKAFKDRLNS